MGTVEKIARFKWPAVQNESAPELKRHWLYEAGILNRSLSDMVFRVDEDGISGFDFEDGAIPETSFDADLSSKVGLDDGAVTVRKLADGVLEVSTAGRGKMVDLFLTTAKFADGQVGVAQLATAIGAYAVPVGGILKMAAETVPNNCLECNGQTVAIAEYPALFGAIGTLWGAGAAGYFQVPDMRGYFGRGWAHGTTNDPDKATRTGGDRVGSVQVEEVKSHNHNFTLRANHMVGSIYDGSHGSWPIAGSSTKTRTTSITGAHLRPKNKGLMCCIRAK